MATTKKKLQIAQTVGSYLFNPVGLSLALLILGITAVSFPASALGLSIATVTAMVLGLIIAPLGALIYLSALVVDVYSVYRDCKTKNISFLKYLSNAWKEQLTWIKKHGKAACARGFIMFLGVMGFAYSLIELFFGTKFNDFFEHLGEGLLKAFTYLSGLPGLEFLAPLANMAVTHVITVTLYLASPLILSYALQKIIGSCVPENHEKPPLFTKEKDTKEGDKIFYDLPGKPTLGSLFTSELDRNSNFRQGTLFLPNSPGFVPSSGFVPTNGLKTENEKTLS
jgi:hypothetical protein